MRRVAPRKTPIHARRAIAAGTPHAPTESGFPARSQDGGHIHRALLRPAAVGTAHASQAVLSTTANSGVADVRAYAAWSLQKLDEAALIAGSVEGASWFTVVSRTRQGGLGYVVIDRFGVSAGFLANLRMTIPLLARAPLSWFETTIPQFNEVVRSFTMGGSNTSRSEVVMEGNRLLLRPTESDRPLKSPFQFEPRSIGQAEPSMPDRRQQFLDRARGIEIGLAEQVQAFLEIDPLAQMGERPGKRPGQASGGDALAGRVLGHWRAVSAGGRPRRLPLALALFRPARTLSWIIARSNSANTPSIWNMALPEGVDVSRPWTCR